MQFVCSSNVLFIGKVCAWFKWREENKKYHPERQCKEFDSIFNWMGWNVLRSSDIHEIRGILNACSAPLKFKWWQVYPLNFELQTPLVTQKSSDVVLLSSFKDLLHFQCTRITTDGVSQSFFVRLNAANKLSECSIRERETEGAREEGEKENFLWI